MNIKVLLRHTNGYKKVHDMKVKVKKVIAFLVKFLFSFFLVFSLNSHLSFIHRICENSISSFNQCFRLFFKTTTRSSPTTSSPLPTRPSGRSTTTILSGSSTQEPSNKDCLWRERFASSTRVFKSVAQIKKSLLSFGVCKQGKLILSVNKKFWDFGILIIRKLLSNCW